MTKAVFFLDIDDCLIKTSRLEKDHLTVIKNSLEKLGIKRAGEITYEYKLSFNRLFDEHQGIKLPAKDKELKEKYLEKLERLQKPILAKFKELKKWSREAFLYISAEKFGQKLTNEQITTVINALWEETARKATLYPDAEKFLSDLLSRKIPIFLITSSDGRLIFDDKKGEFIYSPEHSKELKMKRLTIFLELGILKEHIFIADPIDKPDPWIFRQALLSARKRIRNVFKTIMIGDSIKNDLLPAKKAGMDKLIYLDRSSKIKKRTRSDGIIVVNKLSIPY